MQIQGQILSPFKTGIICHEFGEMRILMFLKSIVLTGFILIPEFPGLTQGQMLSHLPVHF